MKLSFLCNFIAVTLGTLCLAHLAVYAQIDRYQDPELFYMTGRHTASQFMGMALMIFIGYRLDKKGR